MRCIARCGAGTNNIPVDKMTELGIPVFNTPGANANAVKELVVCSLLLASRGIIEGHNHVNTVINPEENNEYAKVCAPASALPPLPPHGDVSAGQTHPHLQNTQLLGCVCLQLHGGT